MAKRLILLRHAKSSWDDPSLDDFDRPLALRGRKAAPLIGREMARRGWLPGLALVSPAVRTRETWALVSAELPRPVPERLVPTIYEAPAASILDAIRETPGDIDALAVIGHNPGLEELAVHLAAADSSPQALQSLKRKFPTGALAVLALDGEWPALAAGSATLAGFVPPRSLGRPT